MPATKSQKDLIDTLAKALASDALPGENEGFGTKEAQKAAEFLLDLGAQRKPDHPAIKLESVSGARHLRLGIINDDMPFLVDSIANTITGMGLDIDRLIHPIIPVRRDGDGTLVAFPEGVAQGEKRESIVYIECARADSKQRRELEKALKSNLADVRAAVQDWPTLQGVMREDADQLGDAEGSALLRWFSEGAMTLLGHVQWSPDKRRQKCLGICRGGNRFLAEESCEAALNWFQHGGAAPLIIKANSLSTVHRRVPIDLIILPVRDDGELSGISIHAGLWTSEALAATPDKVPMLRSILANLMDKLKYSGKSHAAKTLAHVLTTLPHDVLVGLPHNDVERLALTGMSITDRARPKLVVASSPLARHLHAFIWLPRDEVSTGRRHLISEMVETQTDGDILSWWLGLGDDNVALLRFMVDIRGSKADIREERLDEQLSTMVRGWLPAVEEALTGQTEPSRAAALASRYAAAFPAGYRTHYGHEEAARDILALRTISNDGERTTRLYRKEGDPEDRLRLKLYQIGAPVPLSDAVPALENFGFEVIEEFPTALEDPSLGHIHDFVLGFRTTGDCDDLIARATEIGDAIADVMNATTENDSFNQLVTLAGLDQRATNWLRACFRYLRQTGVSYGLATVVAALRDAPVVTNGLIDLFVASHDPQFDGDRDKAIEAAQKDIAEGLANVASIDSDRLLRLFRDLIHSVLRTNAFAPAAKAALAFKIDSSGVPCLPSPIPWREIFVYSPEVEGVHLRAGPVARGGIRWSDRRDDFRTEILGLMKAQRTKNAVIVPTGAKGGFYPKQLPDPQAHRDAWFQAGRDCYKLFINTLLSITDNIVKGKVTHPDQVVIRDGEDPYFVVAADKGTATFSDTANAIAQERGFWLDDAFASGGSNGYDHKAMGITARGAWISVQRHFLEMGIDVQNDPVTVVGCGDMSGDVFGNGMLLSKAIKLVAAFDHRHIFIDPDPDPARSWDERKRLFDMSRSSWADYDTKLLSRGGGIFPRTQKQIDLSPEICAALGIDRKSIGPDELISAILKAPAQLLWFGGIGTYVKGETQSDSAVGDPANDRVRVSAEDLRVKVIGEGANLGVTQAGRIEFALNGGRINTDFIDNSAGVDCSDKEVNIKIALNHAMKEGGLARDKRNKLLESMTDEVGEIVLEDNRLQALALSIAEHDAGEALNSHIRLIEIFEEAGTLDRRVEGLADNETLKRRMVDKQGLTRPELAVLLSTAKLALQDAIEQSSSLSDKSLESDLINAFPQPMQKDYRKEIETHRLRGEIIATRIANRIVNRLGLTHPFELAEEEGASLGHIATAFIVTERLFDLQTLWSDIEDGEMTEQARLALFAQISASCRAHMADILRSTSAEENPGDIINLLAPSIDKLSKKASDLLSTIGAQSSTERTQSLVTAGAPEDLASRVSHLYDMDAAIGLARLSAEAGGDVLELTKVFCDLGARLGLDWAQASAANLNPVDPWDRLLIAGLSRDFQQMRLQFLARLDSDDLVAGLNQWFKSHEPRVDQFSKLIDRARREANTSSAMLAQVAGQARTLLAR